mmetsp:Transcript_49405/g.131105  ORF Transcript_49405/g.131105 Transcript_49405/m.131105 type:complete len:142 (-) Transcript_49405:103-528(-)
MATEPLWTHVSARPSITSRSTWIRRARTPTWRCGYPQRDWLIDTDKGPHGSLAESNEFALALVSSTRIPRSDASCIGPSEVVWPVSAAPCSPLRSGQRHVDCRRDVPDGRVSHRGFCRLDWAVPVSTCIVRVESLTVLFWK